MRMGEQKSFLRKRRAAAGFQVTLMFVSLFAFAHLMSLSHPVLAQSTLSQPSVCCERTKEGALCVNTAQENCAVDARSTPTSCETTSFCKLGTCFDSDEGLCLENTPESVCTQSGGNWDARDVVDIPQCQLGCCIIGDQAAFVPPVRCKKLSTHFGVENNFRTDIDSENECIAAAQAQDMGACVYEKDFERICEFTTRDDCGAGESVEVNGTQLELSDQRKFYKDVLCSAEELNTACAKQTSTTCKDGKVYWVDSCGNTENVYSSDKVTSWNGGRVAQPDEVCVANDGSNENCGNCDYLLGTRCSEYESLIGRPADTDFYCKATECVDRDGNKRVNGESWCVYDGTSGNGLDPVGSRHYREVCIDGEVEVEPCADFRNEICLEGAIQTDTGDFSVSGCRPNRWQECTLQTDADECVDIDLRDCMYLPKVNGFVNFTGEHAGKGMSFKNPLGSIEFTNPTAGETVEEREAEARKLDDGDGVCVPNVPPGFSHWNSESADEICGQASIKCIVQYEKGLLDSSRSVKSGGDCLGEEWALKANRICTSLGDCGGYVNYNDEFTDDGYEWVDDGDEAHFSPSTKNRINNGFTGLILAALFGDEIIPVVSAQDSGGGLLGAIGSFAKKAVTAVKAAYNAVIGGGTKTTSWVGSARAAERSSATTNFLNEHLGGGETLIDAGGWVDGAVSGLQWAVIAYFAGQLLGDALGLDKDQTDALSWALAAGAGVGRYLYVTNTGLASGYHGLSATGWGLLVAAVVFVVLYKDTSTRTITFDCKPWQAPKGGDDCEVCNDDDLPCSEYRCKSLGQTCDLVNKGTEQEKCINVNPNDVTPPTITPDQEVLTSGHQYTDVKSSPPGPGFRIVNPDASDGCLKAFTPLTFGIKTNEQAQCRIDFNKTKNFDDMVNFMGGSNFFSTEHQETFSLPGSKVLQNSSLVLENGKDFTFFIRCADKTGNTNEAEYAVRFCMDDSPDTTPPRIGATSIQNDGCVAENQADANVEFYVNEPSSCRWSTTDQSYDNMREDMDCTNELRQVNSQQLFTCKANLTGIARDNTDYFIRCKDQPGALENDRNVNTQSFKFSLHASTALKLKNPLPNETIFGGVNPAPVDLQVETLFGCSEGRAVCSYATTDNEKDFIEFAETNTEDGFHTQRQFLREGTYDYRVKCVDGGGNVARDNIKFKLEIDENAPVVARAYQEDNQLKIVTVRDSECSYTFDDCDFTFSEGTPMPFANTTVHVAEWKKDETYYIKCRDEFRNEDAQCSIIVKPSDILF